MTEEKKKEKNKKISETLKGRKHSEEHRRLISQSLKRYYDSEDGKKTRSEQSERMKSLYRLEKEK